VVFEEHGVGMLSSWKSAVWPTDALIAKVWSESHVSEDFHLSLRLQIAGFQMRLASYHGEDFKEGVSLTVFDELARWEKYAYGINELVFNPLWKWYKGPITGLYLRYFFMSNIKSSSKLMVLSYTFTYYAIAVGLPLTLANYLLVGWFPDTLDQFYVASWKVIVVILIIFNVIVSSHHHVPTTSDLLVAHLVLHRAVPTRSATTSRLGHPNYHLDATHSPLLQRHLLPLVQSYSLAFHRRQCRVEWYSERTREFRFLHWYGQNCEGFQICVHHHYVDRRWHDLFGHLCPGRVDDYELDRHFPAGISNGRPLSAAHCVGSFLE
jgi:hypothetical protein